MESIEHLIKALGRSTARNIVESQIVYPKTNTLQTDQALYNGEYNGTLAPCILNIQDSIDYKAGNPMKDSISLLILIEEIKHSALLFRADMVVVCKRGFHMIRLVNKAQPKSGRSIYIEVNSCRNDLIRMTQLTVGRKVPWPTIVIAVGVIVSAALLVLKK